MDAEYYQVLDNEIVLPEPNKYPSKGTSPETQRSESQAHQEGHRAKRQRITHECQTCDTSYGERRTLLRHYKTPGHCRKAGTPLPNHACTFCQKHFSRDDLRFRHEKEVHHNVRRSRLQNAPNTPFMPVERPSFDHDHTSASEETRSEPASLLSHTNTSFGELHGLLCKTPSPADSALGLIQQPIGSRSITGSKTSPNASVEIREELAPTTKVGEHVDHSGSHLDDEFPSERRKFGHSNTTTLTARSSLLSRNGATMKPKCHKLLIPCAICTDYFEDTKEDVRRHIQKHLEELRGEHICDTCQVGFIHQVDLEWHQRCAKDRHCGYGFQHESECTGHHAPCPVLGLLSDNDRMRLCIGLRHWEQLRLQAFLHSVEEALQAPFIRAESRWSVGAACRRSAASLGSLTTMMSQLTARSTPTRVDYNARMNVSSVESKVANSSWNWWQIERLQPSVFARSIESSRSQLDNLLYGAVRDDNVVYARRLLLAGANVQGRHTEHFATPLTLAAARGNVAMFELLSEWGGQFSNSVFIGEDDAIRLTKCHELSLTYLCSTTSDSEDVCSAQNILDSPDARLVSPISDHLHHRRRDPRHSVYSITVRQNNGNIVATALANYEEFRMVGQHCMLFTGTSGQIRDCLVAPAGLIAACGTENISTFILLCHAIDRGHANIAVRLSGRVSQRCNAFILRRLLTSRRIDLLICLLQTSSAAAEAMRDDSDLVGSVVFERCDEALDAALRIASWRCITAVLSEAISRLRQDAVLMLCARTTPTFHDPLERQHNSYVWTSALDVEETRTMMQSWPADGRFIEYRRIHLILTMAVLTQRSEIITTLIGAGVPDTLISEALSNIGNDGYQDYLDRGCKMDAEVSSMEDLFDPWADDEEWGTINNSL